MISGKKQIDKLAAEPGELRNEIYKEIKHNE